MPSNRKQREKLWERLDAARLHWESAHDQLTGSIQSAQAIKDEQSARDEFIRLLNEYRACVLQEESAVEKITPRERQILELIAVGKTSKQIGKHLGIAFRTVVAHRQRLKTKLNAHHAADLIRIAIRMGLIES